MTWSVKIYSTSNVLCGDFKVYDDTHPDEKIRGHQVFKLYPNSNYTDAGQLNVIDIFKNDLWVGRSICYDSADNPVNVGQKEDREVLFYHYEMFMNRRVS